MGERYHIDSRSRNRAPALGYPESRRDVNLNRSSILRRLCVPCLMIPHASIAGWINISILEPPCLSYELDDGRLQVDITNGAALRFIVMRGKIPERPR